jgi:dCTP deaminase
MGIGEPAGSVRPPSAPLPDLDGMTADDVNDAFIAAADLVVRDSELLCAAWTVEVCRSGQSYFDDLADSFLKGNTLDVQSLDEAVAARARADTGVSRGLQSIGVHQWLIDNDEHTAEATAKLYNGSFATSSLLLHLGVSATTQDAGEERGPTTEELAVPTPSTDDESSPLADQHLLRRLNAVGPERLVIRPLIDPMQLGGTTVDLRLGTEWEVLRTTRFQALDPSDSKASVDALLNTSVEQFRLTSGQTQGLVLHPGELILALTLEYLRIPADLWGNVEGRSTWARLGLQVHATAGMIDAGFNGYLTLELQNTGRLPMVLTPGLRVAQVAFFPVKGIARSYRSKPGAAYSDQTTARTAFVQQHEHTALRRYLHGERLAEQRELGGSEAGQVD